MITTDEIKSQIEDIYVELYGQESELRVKRDSNKKVYDFNIGNGNGSMHWAHPEESKGLDIGLKLMEKLLERKNAK